MFLNPNFLLQELILIVIALGREDTAGVVILIGFLRQLYYTVPYILIEDKRQMIEV
jgi:hypothetical protein